MNRKDELKEKYLKDYLSKIKEISPINSQTEDFIRDNFTAGFLAGWSGFCMDTLQFISNYKSNENT